MDGTIGNKLLTKYLEYKSGIAECEFIDLQEEASRFIWGSPLEEAFYLIYLAWKKENNGDVFVDSISIIIQCEDKIKNYKYDFMLLNDSGFKMAVEVDGFAFHDRNREQFEYERERQNHMVANGIIPLRVTYGMICKHDFASSESSITENIYGAIIDYERNVWEQQQKVVKNEVV